MGGSTITYLILGCTAALGVFNLIKDWDSHGSNGRRYAVLVLISAVCLLGIGNLVVSDRRAAAERWTSEERAKKSEQREKESSAEITKLQQAVQSEQKAQEINNRSFLEQLNKLYTKAESEHLRKEIRASQQRILRDLKIEPPARLLATFDTTDVTKAPIARQRARVDNNGAVALEFAVFNDSDVPGKPGECVMEICQGCKYAQEPPQMVRPPGGLETERSRVFQYFVPHTFTQLPAKIAVPARASGIEVDFTCGCQNCSNNSRQKLWVDLDR